MQTSFGPRNADEIEMEMTVSMPLKEWKALRNQLDGAWPSWKLSNAIGSLVRQAESNFITDSTE